MNLLGLILAATSAGFSVVSGMKAYRDGSIFSGFWAGFCAFAACLALARAVAL